MGARQHVAQFYSDGAGRGGTAVQGTELACESAVVADGERRFDQFRIDFRFARLVTPSVVTWAPADSIPRRMNGVRDHVATRETPASRSASAGEVATVTGKPRASMVARAKASARDETTSYTYTVVPHSRYGHGAVAG